MNMNLVQAADYLGVPEKKLERWLRQGVIPSHSGDGDVFFVRDELEHWAKKVRLPGKRKQVAVQGDTPIVEAISNGGVYHLDVANRDQALQTAVTTLALPQNISADQLLTKLIEREQIVSTGMGEGVAIPHPARPIDMGGAPPMCGCFYLDTPVDFSAPDRRDVFCMFVLLSPDPATHLKLLSGLAQVLKKPGFVPFLGSHPETDALLQAIRELS